jgi:hypothetical protein
MTITLSEHAIRALGFERHPSRQALQACFQAIHVFAVDGIVADSCVPHAEQFSVDQVTASVAIADSVNAANQLLVGDDYVDDDVKWMEEKGARPPFVLVFLGPTRSFESPHPFCKELDGKLATFDAFREAKQELELFAEKLLPSIVSSLICTLSTPTQIVRLKKIDHVVFGETPDGQLLHDLRIGGNVSISTARRLLDDEAQRILERASTLAQPMSRKAARLMWLASSESDLLKRFLYNFLVIEILTHETFKRIDFEQQLTTVMAPELPTGHLLRGLLLEQREHWKSLRVRFVWCLAAQWHHLSEDALEKFLVLKRLRDRIAHGDLSAPVAAEVEMAEQLALELLKTP